MKLSIKKSKQPATMRLYSILIFSFFLIIGTNCTAFGQLTEKGGKKGKVKPKEAVVEASEVIVVENWMSQEYAEALALRKAKEIAIGQEFGWIINGKIHTEVTETVKYNEYSLNQVKGFWVKTINENWETGTQKEKIPGTKRYRDIRWVKCTVKGRVKEMVEPPIEFEADPLKCTDSENCITDEYKNDEDFFLKFISPVDGYLAVYLEMEESVQALLPYEGMENSFMKIEKDTEYILFSKPREPEYYMFTDMPLEINVLNVIFSKTEFDKPILKDANDEAFENENSDSTLPKEVKKEDFYKWITKLRSIKNDTQVKEILVTIKND
jgi:hypothetical protein